MVRYRAGLETKERILDATRLLANKAKNHFRAAFAGRCALAGDDCRAAVPQAVALDAAPGPAPAAPGAGPAGAPAHWVRCLRPAR